MRLGQKAVDKKSSTIRVENWRVLFSKDVRDFDSKFFKSHSPFDNVRK